MRLLPASLLGRNILLLFVLIVIGQILGGLGFYLFVQAPFIERLATTLADNLIATSAGIRALPPNQREDFVVAFNAHSTEHRSRETVAPLALPAQRMLIRKTSERLAKSGLSTVWKRESGGMFYMQISLDGQRYWLATTGLQTIPNLPRAVLVAWLIGIALALLGALFIQRLINRPLTQLVKAVHAVGRNEDIPRLPENGPKEIADVCRGFNHMQSRLADQDKQRAIMLAGVSHDLRTPLTKIRLSAEIIGEQTGSEYAASIARHCRQIEGIISQFIDFAGIGNREHPVPTNLNRLIAERVHELEAPFALKLDDALPSVRLRPQAVRRMLDNLIENALRYARPPYCIITTSQPGRALILVQDHGDGIPAARVEELLQPFTRGSEARNEPGGSGLGLAIAARVARLEQGVLRLGASENGGLEVRIELPLSQTDPE
ncbi:MAG: ATP-binding protein [Pseudomonadota bacterium]